MEKNIKDYLHLYLGCEVEIPEDGERGKLMGVTHPNSVDQIYYSIRLQSQDFEDDFEIPYNDDLTSNCRIKPILRPLSDMTEEEQKECYAIGKNRYEGGILQWFNLAAFDSNQFIYLLSKHFDLFGLIESGLAIYKAIQRELI